MLAQIQYLRTGLTQAGFAVMGQPSAIVPVYLGEDASARSLWNRVSLEGASTNLVEFPGVAKNRARLRLQVQSGHRFQDADWLVDRLIRARAGEDIIQPAI